MSTDAEPKVEDVKVDEEKEAKDAVKKVDNDVSKDTVKEVDKDEKEGVAEEAKEVEKPSPKKTASKKKETESEEDEEESENEKPVPLLDQPLKQSGPRQRKAVERFETKEGSTGAVEIPNGRGVSLGSISVIEYNIHKIKGDELKKVHHLLFGRSAKANFIKKNIRKFNGFDFAAGSDQFEEKKAELTKVGAKAVAELLSLPTSGSRDELVAATMAFLLEPVAGVGSTGGAAKGGAAKTAALTRAGRPRRTAAARAADKGYSESEDEDDAPRAPRSRRAKGKRVNLKDDSSSEDANDPDKETSAEDTPALSSDESDDAPSRRKRGSTKPAPAAKKAPPPKKPAPKKATPAKKATPTRKAAEKKKVVQESDSDDDDAPLVKKAKAPPTEAEIKAFVKDILQGANLEEITMKTVCKQVYARFPEFDLAHKKDFIKATVKSLIST